MGEGQRAKTTETTALDASPHQPPAGLAPSKRKKQAAPSCPGSNRVSVRPTRVRGIIGRGWREGGGAPGATPRHDTTTYSYGNEEADVVIRCGNVLGDVYHKPIPMGGESWLSIVHAMLSCLGDEDAPVSNACSRARPTSLRINQRTLAIYNTGRPHT